MTTRPLDPTEVYYELIDRLWRMNSLAFIELEGSWGVDRVTEAWAKLSSQVPIVGAIIERTGPRDVHFRFDHPAPPTPISAYDDLHTALAEQSTLRFDPSEPQARCSVVATEDGTWLVLAAHHAALDGRPLGQVALLMSRVLVDDDDISAHPLTAPTEPLGRYLLPERDWSTRRGDMLAMARQIRDEESHVSRGDPIAWHQTALDRDRDLWFTTIDLSREESRALVDHSKANGTTVHGTLAVAVLQAVARTSGDPTRVPLATTVDLRTRAAAEAVDLVGQAASVVTGSYDVTGDPAALAREVTADTRRRVDRAEPELFFAASGVDRLPIGDATDRVVRRWIESATPTPMFSNVGVVTGEAPASVRRMNMALPPIPNQAAFVAATSFRGLTSWAVGLDRNRIDMAPEAFAETLRDCVSSVTDPA